MKRKLAALMTAILVLSLAVAAMVPALAAESAEGAKTGDAARTDAAEPAGQEKADAADPAAAYVGVGAPASRSQIGRASCRERV